MGLLDRLFKGGAPRPGPGPAVAPGDPSPSSEGGAVEDGGALPSSETAAPIHATAVTDILRVEETASAEFYIGDLFRRRFRSDPPDFPHHYVAVYRGHPGAFHAVGYVHYTRHEDNYLCGGMVIDDRGYRRMPAQHRALIRASGGIAELMLRETFARLPPSAAIWGYVGDKQARVVDLRAGFVPTSHPCIMVVWRQDFTESEKAARLAKIVALGLF